MASIGCNYSVAASIRGTNEGELEQVNVEDFDLSESTSESPPLSVTGPTATSKRIGWHPRTSTLITANVVVQKNVPLLLY